ncbi:MAG TPA: RimK family alpha-L-glutamate ligase [Clostridiales bacterium]|nr:RimK family alpha-L-glutamate ligase [Clostridiales bacterium]
MKKHGIIIINSFSYSPAFQNQTKRLIEEFKRLDIKIDIGKNSHINLYLDNFEIINRIKDYDFVVYLDKDKYPARMIEKSGQIIFNRPRAIELCDDKLQTYIALTQNNIKMPKTIPSPLKFYKTDVDDGIFLKKVIGILKFPIVVKGAYGSLGNRVFLAYDFEQLKALREKMVDIPHLYQEFVRSSAGEDTRVIVIGHIARAAMIRKSDKDFRSNIELGGKGYPTKLSDEYIEMAQKASKILGLDYCGIDILKDENSQPILCEVNSNAFFNTIEKVSGVNIAKIYAEYIYDKVYNRQNIALGYDD